MSYEIAIRLPLDTTLFLKHDLQSYLSNKGGKL
jgi:hypothetical protein